MTSLDPQQVGEKFNLDSFLAARKQALSLLYSVGNYCRPGLNTQQLIDHYQKTKTKLGLDRDWHPVKIRIGSDTLKNFRDQADSKIQIQESDIVFIDIGPIIDHHEADLARTFVIGQEPKYIQLQSDCYTIFQEISRLWKTKNLNGQNLYKQAKALASEMGYHLNTAMGGHRLGDFPHALFYKGALDTFDAPLKAYLWVLEIHIIERDSQMGAFFEDIIF
jgi:hypothetical protein